MHLPGTHPRRTPPRWAWTLICLLLVAAQTGCDRSRRVVGQETLSTEIGAIALRVRFPGKRDRETSAAKPAAIDRITAVVYGADGDTLVKQDLEHEGDRGKAVITLQAGDNRRLDLAAHRGSIVRFLGRDVDVDVSAGDTTVVELDMVLIEVAGHGASVGAGGTVTLEWEVLPFAVAYAVRESGDASFSASTEVYGGEDTQVGLTGRGDGTYYYQIKAQTGYGWGSWSLLDSVTVSPTVTHEEITVDLPGGATMDFVWVEPGTFTMGSPESEEGRYDREGPQHEVTIAQGFYLGKYEITQRQWEVVMGTAPWLGQIYVQANPQHPAVYISWDDVQELIGQLNTHEGASVYRLPTEAEWEYSCRAGTTTRWSFGDDEGRLGEYARYEANAFGAGLQYAQPVGTRLSNPWGLFDMHGNVYEWVQDWWEAPYPSVAQVAPRGPSTGSSRVVRGGCFGCGADHSRSASRNGVSPGNHGDEYGGRLLRMTEPLPLNRPPTADAGSDQQAEIGDRVQLEGSGSTDADGDALTYAWTEDGGNPATGLLSDASTKSPGFIPAIPGAYRFILVVNDGQVGSLPDEVTITVEDPAVQTLTVDLPGGATMDFIWIEPGTFIMGSPETESGRAPREGPQHVVTISQGYWLGKYEMTQGQWEAVMGTTPWAGKGQVHEDLNCPAVYISWNDAQDLIHQLNPDGDAMLYRLPTEAEWEYACRAGTTTRWSFGEDEAQLRDYAWYTANANAPGLEFGQPVGTRLPNPWGLFDMHGNVVEWVQDRYGYYSGEEQVDPHGPSSDADPMQRGGCYESSARVTRSAYRQYNSPTGRWSNNGARLLRMAEPLPLNRPPTADAGSAQEVHIGAVIQLDGSGSSDADGDELTYLWTAPEGSPWTTNTAESPRFVINVAGTYRFTLVLHDGSADSDPDEVVITVTEPATTGDAEIIGEIEQDTGDAEIIGEIEEDTGDVEIIGEIEE